MIAGKVNQAQNVIIAGIKGEGEKKGKKREQYARKSLAARYCTKLRRFIETN
jgi:hypothetical protein